MKNMLHFISIYVLPLIFLMVSAAALAVDTDGDGIPDTSVSVVSAGSNHTCALDSAGVHCWGYNGSGPDLVNPVAVSAGDQHTCAIDNSGVHCWGDNSYGQTTAPTLVNPSAVSVGRWHTCALDSTGVHCWGRNDDDQTAVPTLVNPVAVSAGSWHTCALDSTGVRCWGYNGHGETTVPVLVNPVAVSAGGNHTCAIDNTGVHCWGDNWQGQTTVPTLVNPVAVSAGPNESTCAVDSSIVHCWGYNGQGQTEVPALVNPVAVSAGGEHTCALDSTGVHCWGDNWSGQSTVPRLGGDNCPFAANADQLDTDGDGIGDACDLYPNDPSLLLQQDGTAKGEQLGSSMAMADMNNDGVVDLLVGSPLANVTINGVVLKKAGLIHTISGKDNSVLRTINGSAANAQLGAAIAVVADQNKDGVLDIIVGDPLADVTKLNPSSFNVLKDSGRVMLYSGSDGRMLRVLGEGAHAGDHFGAAVAVADMNVNHHNQPYKPYLIVGAPMANVSAKNAGQVTVFDGLGKNILCQHNGEQAGENFGAAIAIDIDNDYIFVGAPLHDIAIKNAGRVYVFNKNVCSNDALFIVDGAAKGDRFGAAITATNGSWAVGAPLADNAGKDAGRVQVFSGLSTLIATLNGATAGDNSGNALYMVYKDGKTNLAVGAAKFDTSKSVNSKTVLLKDAGRVQVLSGAIIRP